MNYYNEIKNELINNEIYKRVKDYSKNRNELSVYYNVGKLLSEAGKHYGEGIIKEYSRKLTIEIGSGYGISNLKRMRQFYLIVEKGVKSVTVYYPEFLRELKGRFGEDYNEVFNKVRKAPLLLLDDIGAETVTNWNRDEILGSLLQYRMQEGLPTFFTSNNTIKELEEHLIGSDSEGRVKSRRIIERIKYLTDEIIMVAENRRKWG